MEKLDIKRISLVIFFGLSSVFLALALWSFISAGLDSLDSAPLLTGQPSPGFFMGVAAVFVVPALFLFLSSGFLLFGYLNAFLWLPIIFSGSSLLSFLAITMAPELIRKSLFGSVFLGFYVFAVPSLIIFPVSIIMLRKSRNPKLPTS